MMKIITVLILLHVLALQGCSSDYSINLGDGYFYRHEGSKLNDILCKFQKGGEIPAEVIAYDFDDNFVIAKQKPILPQDALYEKNYTYVKGSNFIYYWIIIKERKVVLGPLDEKEFIKTKLKHKIPTKLNFKN